MITFNNVMVLNAIMTVYFGFGSLLAPSLLWGLYGLDVEAEGIWALRIIGGLVIANMYLVWSSRNLESASGRRLIASFVVWVWVLYGLIALWGQFAGVFNLLNWTNIVGATFFAVLTYLIRPDEARTEMLGSVQ